MVEPYNNLAKPISTRSSHHTGEGIVIDIGTGDGLFAYQCARSNPRKFYIGVDANPRPLEKLSEKIHRRPAKGGLSNLLFLQAAVEDLPPELNGVADEVHVHFPWGSLLRAVAAGEVEVLKGLRRVCAPGALLEVIVGFDPRRDSAEWERLGLPLLDVTYVDTTLSPRYRDVGFEIQERGALGPSEWGELRTSWAQRLRGNAERTAIYIIARAVSNEAVGRGRT